MRKSMLILLVSLGCSRQVEVPAARMSFEYNGVRCVVHKVHFSDSIVRFEAAIPPDLSEDALREAWSRSLEPLTVIVPGLEYAYSKAVPEINWIKHGLVHVQFVFQRHVEFEELKEIKP